MIPSWKISKGYFDLFYQGKILKAREYNDMECAGHDILRPIVSRLASRKASLSEEETDKVEKEIIRKLVRIL